MESVFLIKLFSSTHVMFFVMLHSIVWWMVTCWCEMEGMGIMSVLTDCVKMSVILRLLKRINK